MVLNVLSLPEQLLNLDIRKGKYPLFWLFYWNYVFFILISLNSKSFECSVSGSYTNCFLFSVSLSLITRNPFWNSNSSVLWLPLVNNSRNPWTICSILDIIRAYFWNKTASVLYFYSFYLWFDSILIVYLFLFLFIWYLSSEHPFHTLVHYGIFILCLDTDSSILWLNIDFLRTLFYRKFGRQLMMVCSSTRWNTSF